MLAYLSRIKLQYLLRQGAEHNFQFSGNSVALVPAFLRYAMSQSSFRTVTQQGSPDLQFLGKGFNSELLTALPHISTLQHLTLTGKPRGGVLSSMLAPLLSCLSLRSLHLSHIHVGILTVSPSCIHGSISDLFALVFEQWCCLQSLSEELRQ